MDIFLILLEQLWPALTAETVLSRIFISILNMSYTACFVIAAVVIVRFLLARCRAPKIFSYVLWGVVLFRLLCPFSFESAVSPLPSTEIIPAEILESNYPGISFGYAQLNEHIIDYRWHQGINNTPPGYNQAVGNVFAVLWLAIGLGLLTHNLLALRRLRHGLHRSAAPIPGTKNIWLAPGLPTAFVLGLLRPQIYLPSELAETEREYILLHEQTHLRRGDHLVKLLAFAALLLHWFNPLVWLAYHLAIQDMEMSCDEAVLRRLDVKVRPDYSASLLRMANSSGKTQLPLAFSEGNVKSRIKNALNYRKPALWLLLACGLAVTLLVVWLAGNPDRSDAQPNTMEELAEDYVQARIEQLDFTVEESQIIVLAQLAEFDDMLSRPVQVWQLEYRLRPTDMAEVNLIEYQQEDGWLNDSLSRQLLVVVQEQDKPVLLGQIDQIAYSVWDGAPLAWVEMAARDCLEQQGVLPPETWPGNHAVVQFPLSDGEICRLLLSQPVEQGSSGIWCVERWIQSSGQLYYAAPYVDMTAREYYEDLQTECNNGHKPWLLDPQQVAEEYIRQDLGQVAFDIEQMEVISPAELTDFQLP